MGNSIAKNLMYNVLLQVVTIILPLITLPYVSRVIGAEGIGTYGYTLSITQFFIIIGTLGMTTYGNRQIAYTRNDKEKMSRTFWSILLLRFITTGIATLLYSILFWNNEEYHLVFMIQTLNLIAAMVDISWLFMGLEDFKKTVIRNLAVKIIGVCLIFIFVKTKNDTNLYVLINVLMMLIGNLVLWMYLPKTVSKVKLKFEDLTLHLVPAIQLFIPQIAIQVYAVLDKAMLGFLTNVSEVGYYDQAQKIIKAALSLVTALGVVMLPRMSNIFATGDKKTMNKYLNSSLKGVAYIAIPMSIGIASISYEFVPWFFGLGFESVTYLLILLAPILFFIAMSNVMGMQYLLPANRTKEFTISVIVGVIVNVMFNIALIPLLKSAGAAIGTVIAEFSVAIVQYYFLRNEINKKDYLISVLKYATAAFLMFIIVRTIGYIMQDGFLTILVQSSLGLCFYVMILWILREKLNNKIISILIRKVKNRG
ncbi:flippase [Robertmurraya andreesenii]|uniref:O-antigen/teichoic acid export membrane protein n=1 Tax=Anoxybacillus andreesenii TaxID=1325932 RepID=A0ABT9UZS3_9BACL|nr:flippase [Robertmurraya andreesenii]MDQ0154189.1 O-antigen/teichoic acid export membrane protein [Robertmurraya andreesenii]